MFLFDPDSAPRPNLAQQLLAEREEAERRFIASETGYTKQEHKDMNIIVIAGLPYQPCGGGRRRLSTRSNY